MVPALKNMVNNQSKTRLLNILSQIKNYNCNWKTNRIFDRNNKTTHTIKLWFSKQNVFFLIAFLPKLSLKYARTAISRLNLSLLHRKIEFMLKNEAYFESEKQKSLISCTCRDLVLTSAATRCLFGRETLGRRNHHQSSTIPLSSAWSQSVVLEVLSKKLIYQVKSRYQTLMNVKILLHTQVLFWPVTNKVWRMIEHILSLPSSTHAEMKFPFLC